MKVGENGRSVPLRSRRWFGPRTVAGMLHRASVKAEGFSQVALDGRPVIGICNSWSELVHCNVHLRGLATAVKRGVLEAGGLPLEFPTISLSENLMKPSTMLYRNLMSMDVEESIRSHPLDADRPAGELRQDGAGPVDGRCQRRRPGDHAHRWAVPTGLLPGTRARRRYGPVGVHGRVPRRERSPSPSTRISRPR